MVDFFIIDGGFSGEEDFLNGILGVVSGFSKSNAYGLDSSSTSNVLIGLLLDNPNFDFIILSPGFFFALRGLEFTEVD